MVDVYLKNIKDCLKAYKVVGIYRPKGVHIGHRIYGFFIRLIIIDIFLLLQTLYFSRIRSIIDFADLLSMQLTYVGVASKSYVLIWKFHKLEKVIENLRELLKFASEKQVNFGQHILKRMNSIRRVFIIYWSTCPSTIFLGFLAAVMDAKEPPFVLHYKIYPLSFFNYEQNYIYFLITEVFEYFGPVFTATTAVAMDFLGVFFFSMAAGLLEELTERVALIKTEFEAKANNQEKKLANGMSLAYVQKKKHDQYEKAYKELKRCIEIHAKIKEFLIEAQNLVSPIIFIQFIISTVVICMTCYTISMFSPADGASVFFRQITYMMPMGLQIFIPCYFGNEIMIAAEKFSVNIFHTEWFRGNKKFRKAFNTLTIHAIQPIIMKCGIIFQITLENFVAVCQLTYKFYAVMQNMNAKEGMGKNNEDQ